jgi:hypothetical protein
MLAHADFAIVRFTLELLGPCRLESHALLGLRGGLLRAARDILGEQTDRLFMPALSSDPVAVRRFQKPAPAFVLRPGSFSAVNYNVGDSLDLEVLFLGDGLWMIDDFALALKHLGNYGLVDGEGCFEICSVQCRSVSGDWRSLRVPAVGQGVLPDVLSVSAWLEPLLPFPTLLQLELVTPARLVAAGRPLRRPRFSQLFPFMLRRVTSMLYYHCALEPVDDPALLLAAASQLDAAWTEASWIDWREMGEAGAGGKLGGLVGQLRLEGGGLDDLGWVIALATLLGIGRGATYGAGQVCIFSDDKVLSPMAEWL